MLAKEIITFLHGEEEYNNALQISNALFSGDVKNLTDEQIEIAFKGIKMLPFEENKPLIELLVQNNIASSKREAREFLNAGAILLNGETVKDENMIIDNKRKYNIIRRGKKKYYIFKK